MMDFLTPPPFVALTETNKQFSKYICVCVSAPHMLQKSHHFSLPPAIVLCSLVPCAFCSKMADPGLQILLIVGRVSFWTEIHILSQPIGRNLAPNRIGFSSLSSPFSLLNVLYLSRGLSDNIHVRGNNTCRKIDEAKISSECLIWFCVTTILIIDFVKGQYWIR